MTPDSIWSHAATPIWYENETFQHMMDRRCSYEEESLRHMMDDENDMIVGLLHLKTGLD